ncbi:MAG: hypothetical protein ACLPWG_12605 [Steroidobacteraceae bacterium]
MADSAPSDWAQLAPLDSLVSDPALPQLVPKDSVRPDSVRSDSALSDSAPPYFAPRSALHDLALLDAPPGAVPQGAVRQGATPPVDVPLDAVPPTSGSPSAVPRSGALAASMRVLPRAPVYWARETQAVLMLAVPPSQGVPAQQAESQ